MFNESITSLGLHTISCEREGCQLECWGESVNTSAPLVDVWRMPDGDMSDDVEYPYTRIPSLLNGERHEAGEEFIGWPRAEVSSRGTRKRVTHPEQGVLLQRRFQDTRDLLRSRLSARTGKKIGLTHYCTKCGLVQVDSSCCDRRTRPLREIFKGSKRSAISSIEGDGSDHPGYKRYSAPRRSGLWKDAFSDDE